MNPKQAFRALSRNSHKKRDVLEQTISQDAEFSNDYARYVIEGRFELGEEAISQSAIWSYQYAHDVIQGRWELGEAAISTSAYYSYHYAVEIIGGRLPDTMHRKMLAFGIIDSSDRYVKRYLDYIGSKKYCTLKRKDTKNESRTSV